MNSPSNFPQSTNHQSQTKKAGREKKTVSFESKYKWLVFWRRLFSRCQHDWIYQRTFLKIGWMGNAFIDEPRNIFTCSKCGYSIHKPGNEKDIEYTDE